MIEHKLNRIEILKELNQIKNGLCIEIGVFKGEYSKEILKNEPKMLYMIDVWKSIENGYDDSTNNKYHTDVFKSASEIADLFINNAIMIRCESIKAASLVNDETVDFLYIDANHAYEAIKKDIDTWFPKVKKGGIFGGHDYLKLKWNNGEKNKMIYENISTKEIAEERNIKKNERYKKFGVFGVNPVVDDFCKKNNYQLNTTNDFFANWWIIK